MGVELRPPYAFRAGKGLKYRFGIDFDIKASEVRTGSGAAFLEYVTVKGEEPPDHTHQTEDEMFYVLEGAITFRCDGKSFDLETGGFIFLPCGVEHGYEIRSETRRSDCLRLRPRHAPKSAEGGEDLSRTWNLDRAS